MVLHFYLFFDMVLRWWGKKYFSSWWFLTTSSQPLQAFEYRLESWLSTCSYKLVSSATLPIMLQLIWGGIVPLNQLMNNGMRASQHHGRCIWFFSLKDLCSHLSLFLLLWLLFRPMNKMKDFIFLIYFHMNSLMFFFLFFFFSRTLVKEFLWVLYVHKLGGAVIYKMLNLARL